MGKLQNIISVKPKHTQVADMIRGLIRSGDLQKGTRLLPERELATKYHVNRHTVAAGLDILVDEKLLERTPRRGTIVIRDFNPEPGKSVSNAVAMVMLSQGDVYKDIGMEISKGLNDRKLYPILINHHVIVDNQSVIDYLNGMAEDVARPYGYLIDGDSLFPFEYLAKNMDRFLNVVFVTKFRWKQRIPAAKYALVDLEEAGRLVARRLISQGHRSIAFLAHPQPNYIGEWNSIQAPMMKTFALECRENNVNFHEHVFWELLHGAPYEKTVSGLFKNPDPPTALFSYPDFDVRIKLLPLMKSLGVVPDKDVEIIGFYNTHHANECGFSSVCIRERNIAEAALSLLTGDTEEREILIRPELVIRSGCRENTAGK